MVGDVKRSGSRIESFTETVPYAGDLYQRLGANWTGSKPTDLERSPEIDMWIGPRGSGNSEPETGRRAGYLVYLRPLIRTSKTRFFH